MMHICFDLQIEQQVIAAVEVHCWTLATQVGCKPLVCTEQHGLGGIQYSKRIMTAVEQRQCIGDAHHSTAAAAAACYMLM